MTKAGERLIEAAREAAAIARGEMKPARVFVATDIDVKAIRRRLKLSQEDFASQFGFTVSQMRDWEQGRSRPSGAIRAYLVIIDKAPDTVRRLLGEGAKKAA